MGTRERAIAYVRVSTDKQNESPEVQRAKIEGYALARDLELVDIIEETASAKSLDRPGLAYALARLKRGDADALIVMKLDRLTRSVADLGTLVEKHFSGAVGLISLGESIDTRSAAGRLILNVLGSVAQWEREAIAERTSAALQQKKRRGERIGGGVPYGYAATDEEVSRLVPIYAELAVVARAKALRAQGASLRDVSARLARDGQVSRSGRPFNAQQIKRMIDAEDRCSGAAPRPPDDDAPPAFVS